MTTWEEKIVETDDPLWIQSKRNLAAAFNAETNAACALVSVMPSTVVSVIALLQYAVWADPDGQTWSDDLYADESSRVARSWHQFLVANLAQLLPGMVTA